MEDLKKGLYPLGRYHFHCANVQYGIIQLEIYPATVTKLNDDAEAIQSYSYMHRNEIIQDLEHWQSLDRVMLRALAPPGSPESATTLTATVENGKTVPPEIAEILNCVSFWNREGLTIYENNIYGLLGNKTTHEQARTQAYDDWLLNSILTDCTVFVKPHADRFKAGKGGHHVWVAEYDERILMIHL